jgi:hypothetical protein
VSVASTKNEPNNLNERKQKEHEYEGLILRANHKQTKEQTNDKKKVPLVKIEQDFEKNNARITTE